MLSQSSISKKVRSDLGILFFYGLQGKPIDVNSLKVCNDGYGQFSLMVQ